MDIRVQVLARYHAGDPVDAIARETGLKWKEVAAMCNHLWARPKHIDDAGGYIFDENGLLAEDLQRPARVVGID